MRGKKSDPEFISQFIQESVREGCETPEQIVKRAKSRIEQIDEEIRAMEAKKIVRSKLLDVINSFEKPVRDKTEEAKLLPFFKFEYPNTCKFLCGIVKDSPLDVNKLSLQPLGSGDSDPQMRFSIKQLLECKVFARVDNQIVCGELFDEYMKLLHEE